MPDTITYELSFAVLPAPPSLKKGEMKVDYLCKGGGELAKNETRELSMPICDGGPYKLVVITADQYDDKLTYQVTGYEGAWKLNMPVFLLGAGAVALLGGEVPEALTFTNGLDKPVTINIYLGWDREPAAHA